MKFITSKRHALTKTYLETLVDEMSKVYEKLYRVYGSHDVCREMAQVICTLRSMTAPVHRAQLEKEKNNEKTGKPGPHPGS